MFNEPKTSAGKRTLFINDDVADFLRIIIGDKTTGLLFLSSNNNLVTTNQVNYSYAAALKAHGIVDKTVCGCGVPVEGDCNFTVRTDGLPAVVGEIIDTAACGSE